MKRILFLLTIAFILFSCSTAKQTQKAINTGNYISAINSSIDKLRYNKTRKGNQDIILLLEEAFNKNTERELSTINFLKKDGNPANFEKIFNLYSNLQSIQNRVTALLPLRLTEENRDIKLDTKDYTNDIIASKNSLSNYLYENASSLINEAQHKIDYRKAYQDLKYLDEINPNYKDTRNKIQDVYEKGIEYVSVNLYNDTDIVFPQRLEEDLLNFNTYGLNDKWTRFHSNARKEIDYDYEMQLRFKSILMSPEQVNTEKIIKEKEIKDGWKYELDENGNVKKDSLGNDIKVDNFKIVKCNYYKHIQFKDVQISGDVSYFDLLTKQQINSYPLTSGFVFENVYADYRGDKRALEEDMLKYLENQAIPFPSDEQMIYDSGEDLKNNIKNIIKRNKFN